MGTPSAPDALYSKISPESGPVADTCPRREKRGPLAAGGATRLATHYLLSHLLRNAYLLLEFGSGPLPLPRRKTLFQFHDFSGFGSGSSAHPKRTPCGGGYRESSSTILIALSDASEALRGLHLAPHAFDEALDGGQRLVPFLFDVHQLVSSNDVICRRLIVRSNDLAKLLHGL